MIPRLAKTAATVDRKTAGAWIQHLHLEAGAIQSYRNLFTANPLRFLVIDGILKTRLAESLGQFLTIEAAYESCYGIYQDDTHFKTISGVTRRQWLQVQRRNRFFKFGELVDVLEEHRRSPNLATLRKFFAALRRPMLRRFFEAVSGLNLGDVDINVSSYGKGDFLGSHSDRTDNTRLAFVFYLTPEWDSRFGGELCLIDPSGHVTQISAEFNRVVLFDVTAGTRHYVRRIKSSANGRTRTSISGWFGAALNSP